MATRVVIGSDHGGFELKEQIEGFLQELGYILSDVGTNTAESCDYPDFALRVGELVAGGEYDRGILVCTTGIGVSISANKVHGIRAALCLNVEQAELTRKHNDSNVLALSAKFTKPEDAFAICNAWLTTEFECGGRHERRVNKIIDYENRTGN